MIKAPDREKFEEAQEAKIRDLEELDVFEYVSSKTSHHEQNYSMIFGPTDTRDTQMECC